MYVKTAELVNALAGHVPLSPRRALAEHRSLRADGCVLPALEAAWREGTSHLLFDPVELPEKVAADTRIELALRL